MQLVTKTTRIGKGLNILIRIPFLDKKIVSTSIKHFKVTIYYVVDF